MRLRVGRAFDDDLHPVRHSAPTEAREAAFARLRICDRIALLSHPRLAEHGGRGPVTTRSACCRARSGAHPWTLTNRPGSLSGLLHHHNGPPPRRAAGPAAMVAIVARHAVAKPTVVAIWMIIINALLCDGYRSVAMSAALGMSLESRDNTGRPNLGGLPWQLLSHGDLSYRHGFVDPESESASACKPPAAPAPCGPHRFCPRRRRRDRPTGRLQRRPLRQPRARTDIEAEVMSGWVAARVFSRAQGRPPTIGTLGTVVGFLADVSASVVCRMGGSNNAALSATAKTRGG